jgi:bacillithiol biosynthesis deacetylase BshB1
MLPLDILVVAAHPDDAEISVGGTIVSSRRQNLRVGILDLTSGEPTPHGSIELRRIETENATRVLDVCWRENLGLPNRSLQPTLDARRQVAEVFRRTRPRIILSHYWQDVHPDHVAASSLCDDARFWAKLSRTDLAGDPWWPPRMLHFLSIHLRIHLSPSVVVDVSDAIERKMEAVNCYTSQLKTGRSDAYPGVIDNIRDQARYWGYSIGTAFGEPLFNREAIGVRSLNDLL